MIGVVLFIVVAALLLRQWTIHSGKRFVRAAMYLEALPSVASAQEANLLVSDICTRKSDPENDVFVIQRARAFANDYFDGKQQLVIRAARSKGFVG